MTKVWIMKQENGKPVLTDFQKLDLQDYCKTHPKTIFRLEPVISTRTMAQNRFYWMYLEIICRETGNDPDDLHEFLKQKLLIPEIVTIKGRNGEYEVKKYKSTTKMNKLEFGEYMEKINALTQVPIPNTEEWLQGDLD
jgi:hypothetical protein